MPQERLLSVKILITGALIRYLKDMEPDAMEELNRLLKMEKADGALFDKITSLFKSDETRFAVTLLMRAESMDGEVGVPMELIKMIEGLNINVNGYFRNAKEKF